MWSQNVRRLDVTLLPRSPWPADRCWESGTGAAQVEAWLEEHTAAAGSDGSCWRMLYSVAVSVVMLPTVSDPCSKNQAWKEVARHPPLSAGPAGPAGAAREEHLLLQRIAPAVGQHCVTSAHLRVSVHIWSPHELRPDESLLPPCLWPAGRGVCGK